MESVWDYPRPPRLEPTPRRIRVIFAGVVVADSRRALRLLETSHPPTYYIPPGDVRTELLEPGTRRSFCEYKGAARYLSLRVGEHVAEDAAQLEEPLYSGDFDATELPEHFDEVREAILE